MKGKKEACLLSLCLPHELSQKLLLSHKATLYALRSRKAGQV